MRDPTRVITPAARGDGPAGRGTRGLVVVFDVDCPACSRVARELPDLVRVPVVVHSCREPGLAAEHPTLPAAVRRCAAPAIGAVRADGAVRWWPGLRGALAVAPLLRRGALREAVALLWTAYRRGR